MPARRLADPVDELQRDRVPGAAVEAGHGSFEYGSGYSTLFYARHDHHVVAVESDRQWYDKLQTMAPANVALLWHPLDSDGDYCRTVTQADERFDVIVSDGQIESAAPSTPAARSPPAA